MDAAICSLTGGVTTVPVYIGLVMLVLATAVFTIY